jgi:hypothetical protein
MRAFYLLAALAGIALNLAALGQDGHNGYASKTASFLNANILSWLASEDPDVILLKIGTSSQDQSGLQTLVNTITTTKPGCHLISAQIMTKYTYQPGTVTATATGSSCGWK